MSGMTISAQRYDEAVAQVRVAIKELEKNSVKFEQERTNQTMAEYKASYCLAYGMLSIMKTLGIKADIEAYILESHKSKCATPFLNWEN